MISALHRRLRAPIDADALDPTPHDTMMLFIGVIWIAGVLSIDAHHGIWVQRSMGIFTWALLAWVCSLEGRQVRAQVLIVVIYATLIEYIFSAGLHTYVYRLDNVPLFVPPGHGLVYGAAITMARTTFFKTHKLHLVRAMLLADGLWALWGVTLSPRSDWLGVFWFACMVIWIQFSKAPTVYVGAFIVVSYLEIVGTSLGNWAWGVHDPVFHFFTIGNPPSGIAGGYCWFDTAALVLAPYLLARWDRLRGSTAQLPSLAEIREHIVVEQAVAGDETSPTTASHS